MDCELMLSKSLTGDHSSAILQDVPTIESERVKDMGVEDIGRKDLSRYMPFHSAGSKSSIDNTRSSGEKSSNPKLRGEPLTT